MLLTTVRSKAKSYTRNGSYMYEKVAFPSGVVAAAKKSASGQPQAVLQDNPPQRGAI